MLRSETIIYYHYGILFYMCQLSHSSDNALIKCLIIVCKCVLDKITWVKEKNLKFIAIKAWPKQLYVE